ncbi:hypothetical protein [Caniella muris]|uniref:hypothetical protein n=1 Tax=Caniella muris TaxID=2941502 RepID=UPI00203CEA45|nr:hypothetical protein [Caniella muris]
MTKKTHDLKPGDILGRRYYTGLDDDGHPTNGTEYAVVTEVTPTGVRAVECDRHGNPHDGRKPFDREVHGCRGTYGFKGRVPFGFLYSTFNAPR